MKVSITAGELIDRGVWPEACDLIGLNPYALTEDLINREYEITLTSYQAFRLKLIKMNDDYSIEEVKIKEEES